MDITELLKILYEHGMPKDTLIAVETYYSEKDFWIETIHTIEAYATNKYHPPLFWDRELRWLDVRKYKGKDVLVCRLDYTE